MGKRAKKRAQGAKGEGFYDGNVTNPYRGVAGGFRAGKRKRGSSVVSGNAKSRKVRAVSGNVTREMLESAPHGAMARVNSRGIAKILHYNLPPENIGG